MERHTKRQFAKEPDNGRGHVRLARCASSVCPSACQSLHNTRPGKRTVTTTAAGGVFPAPGRWCEPAHLIGPSRRAQPARVLLLTPLHRASDQKWVKLHDQTSAPGRIVESTPQQRTCTPLVFTAADVALMSRAGYLCTSHRPLPPSLAAFLCRKEIGQCRSTLFAS